MQGLGKDPGTIQDQRDELIRQLSGLVNVNVTQTEHGLTLTTGNGVPLVVASQSYALQANANNSVLEHVYSAQGQDITSQITGRAARRNDTDSRSGASAVVYAAEYSGQPVRYQLQYRSPGRISTLREMRAGISSLRWHRRQTQPRILAWRLPIPA